MKTKTLNPFFQKTGKYLRELSIVVIGVAITLMASGLISNRSEKNDLALYLNAVKLELEDNLRLAEEKSVYYKQSSQYTSYLQRNRPETLCEDSLLNFRAIANNYFFLSYKTSAFEMFKTSGSMRLIKNKALINAIWDCYASLGQLKEENDYYMREKAKEGREAAMRSTNLPVDIRHPEHIRLYRFITCGVDISLQEEFEACAGKIKNTLGKLNHQ